MRMNPSVTVLLFFPMILGLTSVVRGQMGDSVKEPVPVDSVQITQYMGLWFEIAKIPNRFQKTCARNTMARYRLRDDGRVDVLNSCTREDGKLIQARGIAKIVDRPSHAKLKVSFFRIIGISLFWGDYWIIGLDEDYRWAVVGTPNRKYGWILSREPRLLPEDWNRVIDILRAQGYNPDLFVRTLQEDSSAP